MEVSTKKMDLKYIIQHQKDFKDNLHKKKDVTGFDFKIVSFKLGNEFFGIDIMNVKEIKKIKHNEITRVPNTLPFVKGVLNLRGEIISIIDLAKMFNLGQNQAGDSDKKVLSIIVIKLEENLKIGLIVTEIQRVIALRKQDIQPPSPLLGIINEKYIKGVTEINEKLYVIFDTDAIFSDKTTSKKEVLPQVSDLSEEFFSHFSNQLEELAGVHITDVNKTAFRNIYNSYMKSNNVKNMPQLTRDVAIKLLYSFYSQHNEELWKQPYADQFKDAVTAELKKICSEEVRVMILGCASGQEAFSIYFILHDYFQDADIKMSASDSNLAAISKASGMEVSKSEIPSWIDLNKYFMQIEKDYYKITKEINSKIYFEFHDAKNMDATSKKYDLIVARDLSLYFSQTDYMNFHEKICKRLANGGLYVIGKNESIDKFTDLKRINNPNITLYKK